MSIFIEAIHRYIWAIHRFIYELLTTFFLSSYISEMKFNWLGLILWYFVFDLINDPLRDWLLYGETNAFVISDFQDLIVTISGHFSFFLFGAIAYTGLYFFYLKGEYLKWILFILLAFTLPILFRYFIQEIAFDRLFGFSNYVDTYTFPKYFRDNTYFAFRYVLFGVVYYFVQLSVFKEKKRNELELENQKKDLALLRSQVNPHFLLNAMNNIYALIYHKSDKALGAMDSLSSILKYSLYEQRDFVTVGEEITEVSKLIELNKLRYNFPVVVAVEVDTVVNETEIPPFIILPLIENAFKHGNMKQKPLAIDLKIYSKLDKLCIYVKNGIASHIQDKQSGIGLANIRKRLELIYPANHSFVAHEDAASFEVSIKLPLE